MIKSFLTHLARVMLGFLVVFGLFYVTCWGCVLGGIGLASGVKEPPFAAFFFWGGIIGGLALWIYSSIWSVRKINHWFGADTNRESSNVEKVDKGPE